MWWAVVGSVAAAAAAVWWTRRGGGEEAAGSAREPQPSQAPAKDKTASSAPVGRLVGLEFPGRVESGKTLSLVKGRTEPLYPQPASLYGLSEPRFERVDGRLVEVVTVWGYSLLRGFGAQPARPVLTFHLKPGMEMASSFVGEDRFLVSRRTASAFGEGVELLVGDLREGTWSRLLLQGAATRDLRPELPPETPLVEALWDEYWDAVLLGPDSVLLLYYYDREDVRIVRVLHFRSESGQPSPADQTDQTPLRRLTLVWAQERRLERASQLKRQLYRTDRLVLRSRTGEVAGAGLEFGRLDDLSYWVYLTLRREEAAGGGQAVQPADWGQQSVRGRKFPPGLAAFPDWMRCAVMVRGSGAGRGLAAVYGADGAGRLWLLAQGEVSSLASLALGTLLRRRVGLAVLAEQLPADSALRDLLLRHHSLPDRPNPKPLPLL